MPALYVSGLNMKINRLEAKVMIIKYSRKMLNLKNLGYKTQTRRPIKPQPYNFNGRCGGDYIGWPLDERGKLIECPYGKVGDILECEDKTRDSIIHVGVERIQDISFEDAIQEGLLSVRGPDGSKMWTFNNGYGHFSDPRVAFHCLWDDIYARDKIEYCWEKNPWVWVIEFEPYGRF